MIEPPNNEDGSSITPVPRSGNDLERAFVAFTSALKYLADSEVEKAKIEQRSVDHTTDAEAKLVGQAQEHGVIRFKWTSVCVIVLSVLVLGSSVALALSGHGTEGKDLLTGIVSLVAASFGGWGWAQHKKQGSPEE